MLRFMYTSRYEPIPRRSLDTEELIFHFELYIAADKFAVSALQTEACNRVRSMFRRREPNWAVKETFLPDEKDEDQLFHIIENVLLDAIELVKQLRAEDELLSFFAKELVERSEVYGMLHDGEEYLDSNKHLRELVESSPSFAWAYTRELQKHYTYGIMRRNTMSRVFLRLRSIPEMAGGCSECGETHVDFARADDSMFEFTTKYSPFDFSCQVCGAGLFKGINRQHGKGWP